MMLLNQYRLTSLKQTLNKRLLGVPSVAVKGYFSDYLLRDKYRKLYTARWHPAYHSKNMRWSPPKVYGTHKFNFKSQLARRLPEMGVLEIPKGSVVGKNGWIVGANDILLPEFSTFGNNIASLGRSVNLPLHKPQFKKLAGRCLSLVSTWPGNYCHFLLDSLPRFHLFEKAGFSHTDVDWVYCPPTTTSNAKYLLKQLGFKPSQMVTAADDIGVQADYLLAVSFPGVRRNYPHWTVQFLRKLANLPNERPYRRLYVTRGKWSRKLLNEKETMAILEKYGFEFYDPDQNENQALDFNQAEIVIGPHGAALANIVFCQPGTRFMELIPTDHPFAFFYTLAQSAKLNYAYIAGDSVQVRKKIGGPSKYDFSVNLRHFDLAINQFLAR